MTIYFTQRFWPVLDIGLSDILTILATPIISKSVWFQQSLDVLRYSWAICFDYLITRKDLTIDKQCGNSLSFTGIIY